MTLRVSTKTRRGYPRKRGGGIHENAEVYRENAFSKEKEEKDTLSQPSLENEFTAFWKAYPKKVARKDAFKAFCKIKPDESLLQIMLSALEAALKTEGWQKDQGRYVPNGATWLNGRRWEDELPEESCRREQSGSKVTSSQCNEEAVKDPTGNPAKVLQVRKTRMSVREEFKAGLLK